MEKFSITISAYNDFRNGYKLFKGVASNMRFPQTIKIIRFSLAVVIFIFPEITKKPLVF